MHVYYCQPQFNQKNMFHTSLKIITLLLYRYPSINSPIALYEIISSFQQPFRKNLYLVFKDWQERSCQNINIGNFVLVLKVVVNMIYDFFQMTETGDKRPAKFQRNLVEMFKKPRKVVLKTRKSIRIVRFKFFINQRFRRYFAGNHWLSRK